MPQHPVTVTDAAPSLRDEQAHRRRVYVAIMVVHLVGFAGSYPLYLWQPWAGAVMVLATGLLPWAAVIIANGAPRRRAATRETVNLPARR